MVLQDCDCKAEDFYCEYGFEKRDSRTCAKMSVRSSPILLAGSTLAVRTVHTRPGAPQGTRSITTFRRQCA